jgi:hypothetical protein
MKNIQNGVNYFDHAHTFPLWFKKFIREESSNNESSINKTNQNLTRNHVLSESQTPTSKIKKMSDISDFRKVSSSLLSPLGNENRMGITQIGHEIIHELQKEEDKYDNESHEGSASLVKINPLFQNINRVHNETNNFSQPVQTLIDEKDDNFQYNYDKEFCGDMGNNESDNILNEYEEEMKEQMMESNRGKERIQINSVSPDMKKLDPNFFMQKKSSIDYLGMSASIVNSPRNNYFSNPGNQGESGDFNENSFVGSFIKKSGEFDSSLQMLKKDSNQNKESSASIPRNYTDEHLRG